MSEGELPGGEGRGGERVGRTKFEDKNSVEWRALGQNARLSILFYYILFTSSRFLQNITSVKKLHC
jgi:hypothetical protein